jgi:2-amino-4-hydroxy-6-hydroxymethyldihydropteridine diphosphokinase
VTDVVVLWRPAYIGIGSNLEEPESQVLRAIERLHAMPRTCCVTSSRRYRAAPFGLVVQPEFVNAACGLLTQLEPEKLLHELRAIEKSMGRKRRERWGPRIIDLDLLVFSGEQRSDEALTLPHPGIVERNFVLYPLAEIAPDLHVPGLGRVIELKARTGSAGISLLEGD